MSLRVNFGVSPKRLTDQVLLREHRDLKRLPNLYAQRVMNGSGFDDIPDGFTLGRGRVTYFYNKPFSTLFRYSAVYMECKRRGLKVVNYSSNWRRFRPCDQVTFEKARITRRS